MGILWRRLVYGGLAAGAICLLSGFTLGYFVLGPEYAKALTSRFASPPGAGAFATVLAMRLGFGFLAAFLYVGFRPRFGAGKRTALIAGTTLYLAAYLPLHIAFTQFGIMNATQLSISLLWCYAETSLMSLAAGWIYRE
jgi:hypothetical protein